jgi:hypothetical protein
VNDVSTLIANELAIPLPPPVADFARQIADKYPGSAAVLYYGSCLRTGIFTQGLLDFYLLVDQYRAAHRSVIAAWANAILPPSVYYAETSGTDGGALRCKYAVMTVSDFEKHSSAQVKSPYIWARFAQPCAIVWSRDETSKDRTTAAIVAAIKTLVGQSAPAIAYPCDVRTYWSQVFALTYATEFRAERAGKGRELFDQFDDRYTVLTPLVFSTLNLPLTLKKGNIHCSAHWPEARVRASWTIRMVKGRALHILRLIKSAFTFDGGVDYLAWKITRHSGQTVTVTDWQRRHPVLGSIRLFFELKRRGAIR